MNVQPPVMLGILSFNTLCSGISNYYANVPKIFFFQWEGMDSIIVADVWLAS